MNLITNEILVELMKQDPYWDKKTRELLYTNLIHDYMLERENLFYKRVFFPYMIRVFRLLKATSYPDNDDFEVTEFEEWGLEGMWCFDNCITDAVQAHYEPYFQTIWDSEDWALEEPTLEECLALNVRPTIVPDKHTKHGIQKALF